MLARRHSHQELHRSSSAIAISCRAGVVGLPASCQDIQLANPSAASGAYFLQLGGAAVQAYCDMDTDGGGWMLALNYVRSASVAGTPTALTRSFQHGLPILNGSSLGSDERQSWGPDGSWGHVTQVRLAIWVLMS